jgi:signal transduction histidine kinase
MTITNGKKKESRTSAQKGAHATTLRARAKTDPYVEGVVRIVDSFPILLASFDSNGRCLFKCVDIEPLCVQLIFEESMGSHDSWARVVTDTLASKGTRSLEVRPLPEEEERILVFLKPQTDGEDPSRKTVAAFGFNSSRCNLQPTEAFGAQHLAIVAHELRNPLSNVQAGLKILDMRPSEETSHSTRQLMRRQLDFLAGLVDDLLEATRSKAKRWKLVRSRTDAHHVIHLALQLSGEALKAPGISVDISIPQENSPFDGDAHRLAQVVSNLLDNAVKFTPRGGAISVRATYTESEVCISVTDNGIGLTAEQQRALFQPFGQVEAMRSLSPHGLGLGLFIAKSIVEEHGGRIEVTSEGLQRGASFSVIVPRKV